MNELFERDGSQASAEVAEESNPLKGIDFRRYVWALIRKWRFIVIGFLLFCILGVVAGISLRGKVFNASAVLMYTNPFPKGNTVGEAYTLSLMPLSTLISTVKLPSNIEKIISKLNLNVVPIKFAPRIDVRVQRGSDIITIAGSGGSPQQSADIANATVDVFLSSYAAMRKEEAQKALDRFNEQLDILDKRLLAVTNQMEARRKEKGISNVTTETEFYLTRKTEIGSEVEQSRAALQEIEKQVEKLRNKTKHGSSATPSVEVPGSRQRHKELSNELARLKSLYTSDHPRIVQLEEELQSIRGQVDHRGNGAAASKLRNRLNTLIATRDEAASNLRILEASFEQFSKRMEDLAGIEKGYTRLVEKKQMIKASIAKVTIEKQDAASFVKQLPVEFRVLERAQPPGYASSSKAKLVAVAIPILGFFFLIVVVLMRELRDGTIKTPKELADGFGLPVLSVQPHHPSFKKESMTVIEPGPFEIAVSTLYANDLLKKYKTLGVAAVMPESGQSTVAENIATVLGERGKSVILVRQARRYNEENDELDFRHTPQPDSGAFRVVEFESLGQLLQRFSDFDKQSPTTTTKSSTPPPDMSPKKTLPINWLPTRLESSQDETNQGFSGSSRETHHGSYAQHNKRSFFDHIIIDPLSLYAEPKAIELFSEIDIAVVAVRAGKTRKKQLKSLIAQLQKLDTHLAGAILVDAELAFCDEQIRMSVKNRPVSLGRDFVERYLVKKFLLS